MKKLLGLLLVVPVTCMLAADWPSWRGPNHDGVSTETGWQSVWPSQGPKRVWKANVGVGFASMSVSQGKVYTVGNETNTDTIFCLDAATGEAIWKYSYSEKLDPHYYEGGPSATPTVDGDRVFTFSKSGLVHCLDAATGRLIWEKNVQEELELKPPTWGFAGSALIQGDLVILNAGAAGTALYKKTGQVLWHSDAGPSGYSSPVPLKVDGHPCVALMGVSDLVVVKVQDGSVLWSFPWKTRSDVNAADPVILDGPRFFISSGYNHGCALIKVDDGKPEAVWENKNLRSHFATPVLWEGYLYGVDESQLVCVEVATGELKWKDRQLGKGSVMIADGKLLALSDKGELICAELSPASFKIISHVQVLSGRCWSVPVLANGHIYCRNAGGDVVCLDVSED